MNRFFCCLLLVTLPLTLAPVTSTSQSQLSEQLVATILPGLPAELNSLTFSSDGKHVAYLTYSGGQYHRVINDRIIDTVPLVHSGGSFDIVFSPDGRRIAYKVLVNRQEAIVVDGKRGPLFWEVGDPVFSPDSRSIAYAAATDEDTYFVMVDGQRRGGIRRHTITTVTFGPSRELIAYEARDASGAEFVGMLSVSSGPRFNSVSSVSFSPDGRRLAYWASEAGSPRSQFVVINHKRMQPAYFPEFISFDELRFSPDGQFVAHRGWRGDKEFYVISGKDGPLFSGVSDFTYGPKTGSYAYVAHDAGRAFVVSPFFQGGRGPEHEAAWAPVFSADGSSLAYTFGAGYVDGVRKPGQTRFGVRVNSTDGPMVDTVPFDSLRFSADGTRLYYGAQIGRELWRKVLVVP